MSRNKFERDPLLEQALEEAEGTEIQEDPSHGRALEVEREGAQGVEVFEDPDSVLPASLLTEGVPGHETLTGDGLRSQDQDDERIAETDEEYD